MPLSLLTVLVFLVLFITNASASTILLLLVIKLALVGLLIADQIATTPTGPEPRKRGTARVQFIGEKRDSHVH